MTTEPSTALDEVLDATNQVAPVADDVFLAARARVLAEAEADIVRAARVAHRRRQLRRFAGGLAAAAVVGVLAVTVLPGGQPSTPRAPTAEPPRRTPATVGPTFTTVAQVVDAAATARAVADPTASPYWKVVTGFDCRGVPDADGAERPEGSTCRATTWTGNGRPGISQDADGLAIELPAGTVKVEGRTLTWKQANSRTLTDDQVASMVADNGDGKKDVRAPSGFYVFKNAIELLTSAPASPAIREQLWRRLGAVEGVTFNGRDTDTLGRSGWRLTWSSPVWGSESIVVDTSSGLPLEVSDQAPGLDAPNVVTVVSAGPADEAPEPSPDAPRYAAPR